MRATHTSMTEYLELYNTAWGDLMSSEAGHETTLPEYGNRSIQMTWTVSFEGVKKKNEDAAKMLQVWSYLDNRDIWFEVFNNERNPDFKYWSNPPKWFRRIFRDKLNFKGVAATLLAYSLIEARQDSESYGVHPVVHEWCRNTIITERKPELAFLAITSVAFGMPHPKDRGSWPTQRRLLQHANRFSQQHTDMLEEGFASEQANELHLAFGRLGRLYQDGGPRMWVEAEATYGRALSGHEKLLGLHHDRTLTTLADLGWLYINQKRYVEVEALNRRVVAIRTKKLGPDHTDTMISTFHLAFVLSCNKKLAEAETLYHYLLKTSQMDPTFNKNVVFESLGDLYSKQGKLTESEAMYLQAIAGYKTDLETDHPHILRARFRLAEHYEQDKRLVEAEAMMHAAVEARKNVFGLDEEKTLEAMRRLGIIFEKQGKLAEAEAVYQQALASCRVVLGPEHEFTLLTLDSLASFSFKQDNFTEAEALLLQCLDTFKYIPDEQKTFTQLGYINTLGYTYRRQGRLAEAEAMFQQALAGYRHVAGSEHESTLLALQNLALCYIGQGKFTKAEALLLQELESFKHIADDQKTSTELDLINNLGNVWIQLGKLAEAEAMFQQALTGYRLVLGLEHESTLRALLNLRNCYQLQGKFAEAAALSLDDTDIERLRGHGPSIYF